MANVPIRSRSQPGRDWSISFSGGKGLRLTIDKNLNNTSSRTGISEFQQPTKTNTTFPENINNLKDTERYSWNI